MRSFRDQALVTRTYDFGEADRIVTLLTRNHGVVRAVAKGIRRTNSRFGARVQQFNLIDVNLSPGRNLATLTQADTISHYGKLIDDYDHYTAGAIILEAAQRLTLHTPPGDPYTFDQATRALECIPVHPTIAIDAFILTTMRHNGWEPTLYTCASCEKPGPHHHFHPASGGAVCEDCRPPAATPAPGESLRILWWILAGHTELAAAANSVDIHTAHNLTLDYFHWHTEQRLRSLRTVEQ